MKGFGFGENIINTYSEETSNRTIYVSATGNDATGDGSLGKPFVTIKKALSTIKSYILADITITINVGEGTFNFTNNDLISLSKIKGGGTIAFVGTLALEKSGFTVGSAEANDPLTYAVSGGDVGSWTNDQFKYYFIKQSTKYFPVTHNTNASISTTASNTPSAEIYKINSIFSFETRSIDNIEIALSFSFLRLNFTGVFTSSECNITFTSCYLYSPNTTNASLLNSSIIYFYRCSFQNIRINSNSKINFALQNCYLYGNTSYSVISLNSNNYGNINNVFENPNSGSGASAINFNIGYCEFINNSNYIKIVNSPHAFMFTEVANVQMLINNLIIKNCNYLFRKASSATDLKNNLYVSISTIYGSPNTRYFYDNMYEFINSATNRYIKIGTLIYPEIENNIKYTWNNNTSGNVVVGKTTQNYSIEIKYTIARGALRQQGTLRMSNAPDATIVEEKFLDDCKVTFGKNISDTDIQLTYSVDNSGDNAIVTFTEIKRAMITPLTI